MAKKNNNNQSYLLSKILKQSVSRKEYDNYFKNGQWLRSNWKAIARNHAGKIIIVIDSDIACSTGDTEEARACLREYGSPVQAYVRYVPAENEALLL